MLEDIIMNSELAEKLNDQKDEASLNDKQDKVSVNDQQDKPSVNDQQDKASDKEPIRNLRCVCVTGAGGFIASWLVKDLLTKGYIVKGTVRNPDDPKNDHLMQLEGAATRLKLVKADLMDLQSILSAIEDCDGVFHLATPMTNDPVKVLDPAIRGTLNVLDAAAQVGVRRVVITSSIGTVYMDPHRDPTVVVDESCWSDVEYCRETKNWYCYGKTVAEQAAWDYAREKNLDLVVLIPSLVLGPLLQPTMNASTNHILKYLTGSAKSYVDMVQAYVDVRDVAKACILLYEEPNARGRYLCAESVAHRGVICSLLTELFPQYPVPKMCSNQNGPSVQPYQISNKKLSSMGFTFTPLRKSLHDTVLNLQERKDI